MLDDLLNGDSKPNRMNTRQAVQQEFNYIHHESPDLLLLSTLSEHRGNQKRKEAQLQA